MSNAVTTLLLGGVKSGKSRFAEQLALDSGKPVTVIATARADDEEMRQRIARHQQTRPAGWQVIEEPLDLSAAITTTSTMAVENKAPYVIVDCLTLWVTQLLCSELSEQQVDESINEFIASVSHSTNDITLISNETNMGIMPMDALTRQYCDIIGLLHQRIAERADHVTLMVAGLPLNLK